MKEAFIEKRFTGASKLLIEQANEIIEYYTDRGYNLTLRQLYYQFVARDLIPNNLRSYKRLGSIVNDARLAGLIDWSAIDDRTRVTNKRTSWDNPAQIIRAAINSYHIDRWRFMSRYTEVWVEKEALVEVVGRAASEYDVRYMACRGYVSQSAMYKAAGRFGRELRRGKTVGLIYLGDHDPSGLDISRDIQDRFHVFGVACKVHRIALNMDQVREYNPPPNPAKITDSRATKYIEQYGAESWELDALDPDIIVDLVKKHIKKFIVQDEFDKAIALEEEGREKIKAAVNYVADDDDNDFEDDYDDEEEDDDE